MMMKYNKILFQDVRPALSRAAVRMKRLVALSSSSVFLTACIVMSVFSSCAIDGTDGPKKEITIEIENLLPESMSNSIDQSTKHFNTKDAGTAEESAIHSLAYFVFSDTGIFEMSRLLNIDPNTGESSDPNWVSSTKSLKLVLTVGKKKIYVVANWPVNGGTGMPDISGINTVNGLQTVVREHSSLPENPPVMTGYLEATLTAAQQGIKVQLTRQIVRVDIYPKLSADRVIAGANVKLEAVKFVNMASRSFLFDGASSPAGLTKWDQTGFTTLPGNVAQTISGTVPLTPFIGHHYVPEFYGSESSHTSMVLKGTYNGQPTYYAIALNGHAGAGTKRYQIERNHSYKYTITIEGPGETSLLDALNAETRSKIRSANVNFELVSE